MTDSTDTDARSFVDASARLCEALMARIAAQDPDLLAMITAGLQNGERLELAMIFAAERSEIAMRTIDSQETRKRIITVPARMPTLQ